MQILEKNKEEVQKKAESMSDFLRMEYLENCSRYFKEPDILIYSYKELAKLYERRSLYSDALKYLGKLHEFCKQNKDKINVYLKETELLIRGGYYDNAQGAYKSALKISNSVEKYEIKKEMVNILVREINRLEKEKRNVKLQKVYEMLMPFLSDKERTVIRKRLVIIYQKLGKVRESIEIEKTITRTTEMMPQENPKDSFKSNQNSFSFESSSTLSTL